MLSKADRYSWPIITRIQRKEDYILFPLFTSDPDKVGRVSVLVLWTKSSNISFWRVKRGFWRVGSEFVSPIVYNPLNDEGTGHHIKYNKPRKQ